MVVLTVKMVHVCTRSSSGLTQESFRPASTSIVLFQRESEFLIVAQPLILIFDFSMLRLAYG